MNNNINLIFPISGKGERFGGTFKPFLKIGDLTFLEKSVFSFGDLKNIKEIFFICTQEQENNYNVTQEINKIFDYVKHTVIVIPNQTLGPYETIKEAFKIKKIKGKSFVCDCDHFINTSEILPKLMSNKYDVVVPTYKISKSEYNNWSKVIFDDYGKILKFINKEKIDFKNFEGVIGCIGFKEVENLFNNDLQHIYELLNVMIESNKIITTHEITDCLFYGDIPMYEKTLSILRNRMTIFCDVDGVLIKHSPHSNYIDEENLLLNGVSKLQELSNYGHKIILTTARNKKFKKELIELLKNKGISYDEIIMGCNPGPRILINDRKPSHPFLPQSNSIELIRDFGLSEVNFTKFLDKSTVKILKTFDGNSFAKTYLVENNGNCFIRKHIIKNSSNHIHYEKLKRQYQDIKRYDFLISGLVPSPFGDFDSEYEYYYDIEYKERFFNLSKFEDNIIISNLKNLLNILKKIYHIHLPVSSNTWINTFLKNKIYNKLNDYQNIDSVFNELINSEIITINNKKYYGIKKILSIINIREYEPKKLSQIHGDLTLENILTNGKEFCMIDMDGSDLYDAAEHDLGKLSQSILSRYHIWNNIDDPIFKILNNKIECENDFFNIEDIKIFNELEPIWSEILNRKNVLETAIFYMSCYFIRFVPFRLQKNTNHGYFALIMAIVWLNKLNKKN